MGLLDSLVNLVEDVALVVTKPVEMALDLADAAVKPIADAATELAKDAKDITK